MVKLGHQVGRNPSSLSSILSLWIPLDDWLQVFAYGADVGRLLTTMMAFLFSMRVLPLRPLPEAVPSLMQTLWIVDVIRFPGGGGLGRAAHRARARPTRSGPHRVFPLHFLLGAWRPPTPRPTPARVHRARQHPPLARSGLPATPPTTRSAPALPFWPPTGSPVPLPLLRPYPRLAMLRTRSGPTTRRRRGGGGSGLWP
jgi:hypothetical protein